jgi:hypothetical protein
VLTLPGMVMFRWCEHLQQGKWPQDARWAGRPSHRLGVLADGINLSDGETPVRR